VLSTPYFQLGEDEELVTLVDEKTVTSAVTYFQLGEDEE
jgi:hypothetical protein